MAKFPTITATKQSSSTALLEWASTGALYTEIWLEVSVDGGGWTTCASLDSEYPDVPTSMYYMNMQDEHSYRFRGRGYNKYNQQFYEYSDPSNYVYGDTSAPISVTGRAIASSGGASANQLIILDNPSTTAVRVEYEIFYGWVWREGEGGSSTDTQQFEMYVPEDGVRVRVRNVNSSGGVSEWTESDELCLAKTPLKPTVTAPMGTFRNGNEQCVATWTYNNIDNSLQSAFQFRYKFNGASAWLNTVSRTTESTSYGFSMQATMQSAGVSTPCTFTFQVRTKGAVDDYSEWSDEQTINVYNPPTLSVSSPTPQSPYTGLPINVVASYSDMQGFTCQYATVSLTGNGKTVSKDATIDGGSITAQFNGREFTPENDAMYQLKVDARSSSGLSVSYGFPFRLAYTEPAAGRIVIRNNSPEGSARLIVQKATEEPIPESIEVKRLNPDGSETLLHESTFVLSSYTDKYAPLNTDYRYSATTYDAGGAAKTVYFDNNLPSSKAYFYFGDDVASGEWQQTTQSSYERPHQEEFYFSGRELPVLIDDEARSVQGQANFTLRSKEEVDAFKRLMMHSGSVVYKSTDGDVMHVKVSVSMTRQVDTVSYYLANVSVKYKQVDGVEL